ncbi:hypothetical protein [Pseudarthrobacter oxydans]|uniref:hypothetical protein n=1 Tax=Pseudarthrobacter oxydans TaxID=1671 RepID=UPI00344E7FA7
MSNTHPPGPGTPIADSEPPPGIARSATSSLMLAVIAPASIYLTFPVALIALMGAADSGRHTLFSWLAPLIFWSLPLPLGVLSISLALSTIRRFGPESENGRLAVKSLWISGVVSIVGFFVTLRFMHGMRYF